MTDALSRAAHTGGNMKGTSPWILPQVKVEIGAGRVSSPKAQFSGKVNVDGWTAWSRSIRMARSLVLLATQLLASLRQQEDTPWLGGLKVSCVASRGREHSVCTCLSSGWRSIQSARSQYSQSTRSAITGVRCQICGCCFSRNQETEKCAVTSWMTGPAHWEVL